MRRIRDLEAQCPGDLSCNDCSEDKYCQVDNPSWKEIYHNLETDPDKYWITNDED